MRVKICGITNLEDALLCYEMGADALGFIFVGQSPRHIRQERCQYITSSLPPFCERVGVFLDEEPEIIAQTVRQCRLSAVQLHGISENTEYISKLQDLVFVPIIRAFRLDENSEVKALIDSVQGSKLQAILLDGPGRRQISPEKFVEARQFTNLPLILAGAVNAQNVNELIERSKPDAIDLSSSLEAQPGKKDKDKVKEFFLKLRSEATADI